MDLGTKPIFILDGDYFPLLYRFRDAHPEVRFMLLTPEDCLSRLGLNFVSSPLVPLMKQGMDYVAAKKWSNLLRLDNARANPKVQRVMDSLPKELFRKDPLGEYELSHGTVYLIELQEDVMVHSLLERHRIAYNDISLEELGIEPINNLQGLRFTLFRNKYEQFDDVFASLRERFLKEKKEGSFHPNNVRLLVQNESDAFYLSLLGKEFGIPVRMNLTSGLYSVPGVAELCAKIDERKSLSLTAKDDATEAGKIVSGIIKEFELESLPFDLASICLFEILQSQKNEVELSRNGVLASSSFVFSPEKDVYVTCLQHGCFYNIFTDDDVLNDAELLELGANPSYVKTSLDCRKKENFLKYHRFALLSRAKQHLDEKIYDSQFKEPYKWSADEPERKGTYSSVSKRNRVMSGIDRAFYPRPIGVYHSYDSTFKGIQDYKRPKDHFSITNLEKYRYCPYRYYLNTVIKDTYDLRPSIVGTMMHKAFENIYSDSYDLETALADAKQAYLDEIQKMELTLEPMDEVLIEVTLTNLRRILPLVLSQKSVAKISESWSEEGFAFSLKDEEGEYPFVGRIDNIIRFEDGQKHYLVINDFKSGVETFHPYECFLGASTQLPIYLYAIQNGEQYGKKGQGSLLSRYPSIFAGMGIKTIAANKLSKMFGKKDELSLKTGLEYLGSKGVYLNDESFWAATDPAPSVWNGSYTGKYFVPKSALFDSKGNGKLAMMQGADPYGLEELMNDAIQGTLDVIHAVLKAEFPIAPTSTDLRKRPEGRSLQCSYCGFGDICYRNLGRDTVDYASAIRAKFMKGGNDDGVQ